MNIKPNGDRLIVKQDEAIERLSSGIFIPENSIEKPQYGTVVAIGNKSAFKINDRVCFSKYMAQEICINGTDLLIFRENDILATI